VTAGISTVAGRLPRAVSLWGLALACLMSMSAEGAGAQEAKTYTYDALGRLVKVEVAGGPATGVQTITQFDPAGNRTTYAVSGGPASVAFAINSVTATEGGPLIFTVTKTGTAAGTITINYATANGTAGVSDYTNTSGTLTFLAGETSKTISVPTTDDALVEGGETLTLTLSSASGGATISGPTGTGTIIDNDVPSFAIANASAVAEGGSMTFTVTRGGGGSGTYTVNFASAAGTATSGTDFTPTSGTLTFLATDTTKTITVATTNDAIYEPAETVLMNLSAPSGGSIITMSQGSGIINDNDSPPSFAIGNASAVSEGGTMSFAVVMTGGSSSSHSVNYASASGTAISGTDFTGTSGTLTFAPGETSKTINVASTEDAVFETAETVLVNLSGATGGTMITGSQGAGTINDNDPAPAFSIGNASAVTEGGTLSFTVTKSGNTSLSHSVNYASANGTASAGSDYTPVSGTLTFLSSETSKTVSVPTIDDSVSEPDKTVLVNLSSATSGATIATGQGSGLIVNNDITNQPPVAVSDSTSFNCSLLKTLNVVANDTDPENNLPLQVISVTAADPSSWASVSGTTSVQLGAEFAGTYFFTYVVADSLGATSNGTISASVTGSSCLMNPNL